MVFRKLHGLNPRNLTISVLALSNERVKSIDVADSAISLSDQGATLDSFLAMNSHVRSLSNLCLYHHAMLHSGRYVHL